ncbi:MAG: DUF1489 domain-containing protein [Dongiaceae bacterium]
MAVHLLKLCVGVETVQDLRDWHKEKLAERKRLKPPRLWHVTRTMPKRRDEILKGKGSLYWVIKGFVQVRQPIVTLDAMTDREGLACCRIGLAERLILVTLHPHRPFQGWRYLEADDAPADLPSGARHDELPAHLLKDLRDLGLA